MINEIRIFSPATVSNVACGFDVLGFALDSIGDEMIVRKTAQKGLIINNVSGFDLPMDIKKNVATVSASELIEKLKPDCGFEIEFIKKIKPGSGIGSSGASAAGSVYAINKLMGDPFTMGDLIKFAMKDMQEDGMFEHPDNIAPALLGGFVLVKSISPLEIIKIPFPNDLYCTIVHPKIEVKTSYSRSILPNDVSLEDATKQLANFGSLIHGLHTNDYDLIKSSLNDHLIERHRSKLIPKFQEIKSECLSSGALGCSISGSGPSIFALSRGIDSAKHVEESINRVYSGSGLEFSTYVSKINDRGVEVIENK
ncbi:MAG: homoserine kinase [Flavobacteriaceae bacterium]|jgi:homoserine kinase|nr:homoserine kinase [Flavobacteriaceae bacterium]